MTRGTREAAAAALACVALFALAALPTVRARVEAADAPPAGPAPAPRPAAIPTAAPPAAPATPTVVHVPTDEMETLLRAQGKGVLLRYDEYRALLDAARAKEGDPAARLPEDVVRLSGEGTLDLSDERAARFAIVYRVQGLASGPRSIGFDSGGVAFESVRVEPEGSAGSGRYEARDGRGRIHLDGPGVRRVTVAGSAVPTVAGGERRLDLWLPNPAAMALSVTIPAGVKATIAGEGAPLVVQSSPEQPSTVVTRPTRGGHLVLAWAPAAQGVEGPAILDADVKTLLTVGEGVVSVRALVRADVLRTRADTLVLDVPPDLAVHAVEGPGITAFTRSDDRKELRVKLEKPVLGRVEALVQGEHPFRPGLGVELPRVRVAGALRHLGEAALRFGPDVNARAVHVEGGRRVAQAGADPTTAGALRFALSRADARLTLDVDPGVLRVDATGSYYLNLAEPGQTLIAIVTYRVVEGTLFRVSPRFPREFELRELTVNGRADGFSRDATADGRVELTLEKGVPSGGEVLVLATLERARADWVPETGVVSVPFTIPSAGATREEGYAAVGADLGFEVLDKEAKDLVAVGAADLAARGLSSAGLLYGYRIDGPAPAVTLDVSRRAPRIEADVVTVVHPGPRRVDLAARAVYRIQRAGVRRLFLDLPSWAGDQVDVRTPYLRAATRLVGERRPADVPEGYDRWQVDLEQRAIGTQVVTALWFLTRDVDDWSIEADRRLAARVPIERAERLLVVRRSAGLEVGLPRLASTPDVRSVDTTEMPPEALLDAQAVLEVLRLPPTRDGVEVAVKKHTGAAVLGAIATEVSITTAVSREGILRTRAEVTLFNIDRQFVEAALPQDSTLVGAIVDGQPVKPLTSPTGTLLVTVPSTLPTAAVLSPRVVVALTYETRVGGTTEKDVRIAAPRFPGLEVLHTTHEVGVEDEFAIASVAGDLLATGRLHRPSREPWLASVLAGISSGCGGSGGGYRSALTTAESVDLESDERMNQGTITIEDRSARRSRPFGRSAAPGSRGDEDGSVEAPTAASPAAGPGLRAPSDPSAPPPPPSTTPATTSEAAAMDAPAQPPGAEPPSPDDGSPEGKPESGGPDASGKSTGAGGRAAGRRGGLAGRARKGQLSLDVPVFLAPNRVIASRIGGGGAIELDLVSRESSQRAYLLLGLLALTAGVVVVATGRLAGWMTVLAGLAVALVLELSFGARASTLTAAVADAATLLAILLVLRRLVDRRPRRPGRAPLASASSSLLASAPPSSGTAAVALLAVISLAALATATAAPAFAEDAAAPAPEPLPASGAVIVTQDPAQRANLAPDDRVFVPLATWLELERQAHPDRDPEQVALGRVVTIVEAAYRMDVGPRKPNGSARGTARLVFAQRGRGALLAPVPLSGVAISDARLDGQPVRLLLDGGIYRVALDREGDHVLDLQIEAPVALEPAGRQFTLGVPTFAGATLDVTTEVFDGELRVSGAGRVEVTTKPEVIDGFEARAYLGRPNGASPVQLVTVTLAERTPTASLAAVRTRAESRVVHSVRDSGTESALALDVHVLQGEASFIDLSVPAGVEVLDAAGSGVTRWETGAGRLRLVLGAPTQGKVSARIRTFRPSGSPERTETLPEIAVLDTTGESGLVVVNGDASLRLEAESGPGLFRTSRPAEADASGADGLGRVLGAWRFSARPATLAVRAERSQPRLEVDSRVRVTFGDDRVRSLVEARVRVQRAPVGDLVFGLPGVDEVRAVDGEGIETWWLDGDGDARRLFVRVADLFEGERAIAVRLERRLAAAKTGIAVPRLTLAGAQADRGHLVLFALPDVEPVVPAAAAGWKALPPTQLDGQEPDVIGARATHLFEWDAGARSALLVDVRTPEQEVEAVVVTQVSPSDEEQRLEHLVLFDVRRGAADRLSVFVPDGGLSANDVVRARDLRELRSEPASRADADGKEVKGRLYTLRLQSSKSGLVEVTVSQLWPAGAAVHVVRPEGVKATRWFGLVRTFLDGEVETRVLAGAPDPADWADLPFLPTGLVRTSVLRTYAARAPYILDVVARRHRIEAQADAVVLAAKAEVVVGLDGEARVRLRYRLFNRARQFLRVRLPDGAVLFGAVAADRPIKPLAGPEGTILLPVPKVSLGGLGYEVAITYRARAGEGLESGGSATLLLPQVIGVEVDRTIITLRVPAGFSYAFDTKMSAVSEGEALGDDVEASLREAQEVLKVAETGTLEQRMYACSNSSPLVEQARARLEAYQKQGTQGDRKASLQAEIDRLSLVQSAAVARCQSDAGVAKNEEQFVANSALSSNADGFLLLGGDSDNAAGDAGRAKRDAEALAAGANWTFNGVTAVPDAAAKTDKGEIAELKGRMQRELQRRGDEDRRKSVDIDAEARSRADPAKPVAKEIAKRAADEATVRFDENRNNALLNERLHKVQTTTRQAPADAGGASPGAGRGAGGGAGGGPGAWPSSGEPGSSPSDSSAAAARVGLLGVDVPLPKDGVVYWFAGARAGSAVGFDASPSGTPVWQRSLLALALFGALAFGLVRLSRRRAMRTA